MSEMISKLPVRPRTTLIILICNLTIFLPPRQAFSAAHLQTTVARRVKLVDIRKWGYTEHRPMSAQEALLPLPLLETPLPI